MHGNRAKDFTEGKGWIVFVEKEEEPEQSILIRRIITFRKVGEHYRLKYIICSYTRRQKLLKNLLK